MSTTRAVTYGNVHVRGPWQSAKPVTVELVVYTDSGQARIAELDERELLQLNRDVAEALRQLQVNRIVCAGAELQPVPEMRRNADDYTDCSDRCYGEPCVHRWPSTYRGPSSTVKK